MKSVCWGPALILLILTSLISLPIHRIHRLVFPFTLSLSLSCSPSRPVSGRTQSLTLTSLSSKRSVLHTLLSLVPVLVYSTYLPTLCACPSTTTHHSLFITLDSPLPPLTHQDHSHRSDLFCTTLHCPLFIILDLQPLWISYLDAACLLHSTSVPSSFSPGRLSACTSFPDTFRARQLTTLTH